MIKNLNKKTIIRVGTVVLGPILGLIYGITMPRFYELFWAKYVERLINNFFGIYSILIYIFVLIFAICLITLLFKVFMFEIMSQLSIWKKVAILLPFLFLFALFIGSAILSILFSLRL